MEQESDDGKAFARLNWTFGPCIPKSLFTKNFSQREKRYV